MSFRQRLRGGRVVQNQFWSILFAGVTAGQDVTINAGQTVIFDLTNSPVYNCVEISGTVIVDQSKTTQLNFNCMEIMSGAAYRCGTTASPYPRGSFTHTLSPQGARASDPSVANPTNAAVNSWRGIMVMDGGELSLVGAVPSVTIFKLGADAVATATTITADQNVTLKAGDQLELTTTKYYSEGMSDVTLTTPVAWYNTGVRRPGYGREVVTVASDVNNSTTIPISASNWPSVDNSYPTTYTSQGSLKYSHYGRLQYVVAPANEDAAGTNLSNTNVGIANGDVFGTINSFNITGTHVNATVAATSCPTIVDHRASVGLLTHPIRVQAPNDTDWQTHGYGAQVMAMGNTSKMMLQGVQFRRCGQAGFLGRYPTHWHMNSYTIFGQGGSGTFLGDKDPTYNYQIKCATWESSNRGVTIHGTNGLNIYQNVFADIDTHCIFLEDGSEKGNVIDGNLISGVGGIRYGKDNNAVFTGSTSGNVLTVTAVTSGTISVGQSLVNNAHAYIGEILGLLTGAGGTGTYTVSNNTTNTSQTLQTYTRLKVHDIPVYNSASQDNAGGAAGIWYTNAQNYLRNNRVYGAVIGIWNALSHPYYTGYHTAYTNTIGGAITGNGTLNFIAKVQSGNSGFIKSGGDFTPVGMQAETITLTCTNASTPGSEVWSRSGSLTGAMSSITTGVLASHGNGQLGGYTYILAAGATPFAVNDKITFDVKRFGGCFGASRDVALTDVTPGSYGGAPGWQDTFLQHHNNTALCNAHVGMMTQPFVADETGRTAGPNNHLAAGSRIPFQGSQESRFTISSANLGKNTFCQYMNESDHPLYLNWVVAGGRRATTGNGLSEMIQGNVNATLGGGLIAAFDGCLFAPKTLDDYYGPTPSSPMTGGSAGNTPQKVNIMVSYGGGINRKNCIMIPCAAGTLTLESAAVRPIVVEDGATMRLWDFYASEGVSWHFAHDNNSVILGADPGYLGVRTPPIHFLAPNFPATEATAAYSSIVNTSIRLPWAQATPGAMKLPPADLSGNRGQFGMDGGWHVYDRPACYYGTTGKVRAQSSGSFPNYNGWVVDSTHRFLGLKLSTVNGSTFLSPNSKQVFYYRMLADGVTPLTNGDWYFYYGDSSGSYADKKYCTPLSMATGGTPWKITLDRVTDYPALPTSCAFDLHGMNNSSDHIAFSMVFDHTSVGAITFTNGTTSVNPDSTGMTTLTDLLNATTNKYWVDTANDEIWFHLWGAGMTNQYASDTDETDRKWRNTYTLTVA